jgi:hypothetical protein
MLRQVKLPRILAGHIDKMPVVLVDWSCSTVEEHLIQDSLTVWGNRDGVRPVDGRIIVSVEGMFVCCRDNRRDFSNPAG